MFPSPSLSAKLRDLVATVDLDDVDVDRSVRELRRAFEIAVPSFLGLLMTVRVDGHDVALTSMDGDELAAAIGTSLRMPLSLMSDVAPGSQMVLYARNPGAFVDLAADLRYALSLKDSDLVLDEHLPSSPPRSGLVGVEEMSIVNRAVGILIGRGNSPEEARGQLERQATKTRLLLYQIAAHMISSTE